MVHVFLVDTGTTYYVDVDLKHLVSQLNEEIARVSRIPVDKQVLLVSGGAPLFPDKPLFHYEATLVDNPVYLICKATIPEVTRPSSGIHSYSDRDLTSQVEASAILPAALETVRSRTQLAQHICQVDKNELRAIEKLVYDQHLQQQGWAAVVANLEDLVSGFEKRVDTFQKQFREFLATREDILALIRRMPEVLILLEKIPLLPCLENLASKTSVSIRGPLDLHSSVSTGKLTLYMWMNSQDAKFKLEDVILEITTGTHQMGVELEERVTKEVHEVVTYACGPWPKEMKSIRGLEERLYGLDKLVQSAKTNMESQDNMRKGFELNWSRLQKDVKDTSILPDLCTSHRTQMREMLANHRKLLELKKKCADAKKELSENLKHRLTWVMETHHLVNDMDNRLLLYYDWLNRINRRAVFLRQVEQAPQVYAAMVSEVARRLLFSQHYQKWAKGVADESRKEHKKEMHRRKSFSKQFGSHFLQKLFIGFRNNVPKFATEPPKDVDSQLPDITPADVEHLAQCVPELRHQLRVPSGTGSPALASSFQQPLAADGGSDPLMLEVTQSLASSTASFTTQSCTSVTQSVDTGQSLLFGPRLSLSYHEGEPEDSSRLPSDDQLFMSLQGKFQVPQCLSETLTAEVNSAAMSTISASAVSASPKAHELTSALEQLGQQQPPESSGGATGGGGGEGPLFSSGDLEPAKSSDSDAISHDSLSERKPRVRQRRGTGKGLSDTSPDPDLETSQEFTTADFYIEDSMPSSMTDSPPKQPPGAIKDRREMDAILSEKTKRVGELEGEVSALRSQLAGSAERLCGLQSALNSDITSLRGSLADIRESVRQGDGERVLAVSGVEAAVVRACTSLVEAVEHDKLAELSGEREGARRSLEDLESQLQSKSKMVEELQQGMLKVTHGIADLNKELQQERDKHRKEVEELKEKHAGELQELAKKNMLEVELETDRVQAEMTQRLDQLDSELQRLQKELEQSESHIMQVQLEKDSEIEKLGQKFAEEKNQLEENLSATHQHAMEEYRATLMEEQEKKQDAVEQEARKQMDSELQKKTEELESAISKRIQEREDELTAEHAAQLITVQNEWSSKLASKELEIKSQSDLESAFEKRLQEKVDELLAKHADDVKSIENEWLEKLARKEVELQREFELKVERVKEELQAVNQLSLVCDQSTQSEEGEMILMERYQELMQAAEKESREKFDKLLEAEREERERILGEMETETDRRLKEMEEEKARTLKDVEEQHQKDKEEAVQSLKTKVAAERQIQFNEAIMRAVQEKDTLIAELRDQLDRVTSVDSAGDEGQVESQNIKKELEDIKEKETYLKGEKQRLENEVSLLQTQLRQRSEQLHSMTASAVPLVQTVTTDGASLASSSQEEGATRLTDWEQVAHFRELKINELEGKLMNMSMTASVRKEVRDKVSILTCSVGDLVLLCLDERHDQYVVFTVGSMLHFLHSDCLDSLGLKSGEGEFRKNWVLAEITEREYCQARKAQNRFKVPVNTKFYRVKAKAWSPASSSSTSSPVTVPSSSSKGSPVAPVPSSSPTGSPLPATLPLSSPPSSSS